MTTNGNTALAKVEERPGPATAIRGIEVRNIDDLARLATMAAKSGLAAKSFVSAEACGVAIAMGIELGFSPMQSLNSVVVINGRPGLTGAAALALVEASGLLQEFMEWFEVGGKRVEELPHPIDDTACAACMVRRRGRQAETTRFGVKEAKRAKLWSKPGPWTEYPQRMLMFRARGFRLNDSFPDVLKGFKTVEELRDYPDNSREANMPVVAEAEGTKPAPAPAQNQPTTQQPPNPERRAAIAATACKVVDAAGSLEELQAYCKSPPLPKGFMAVKDEHSAAVLQAIDARKLALLNEEIDDLYEKLNLDTVKLAMVGQKVGIADVDKLTAAEALKLRDELHREAQSAGLLGDPEPTEQEFAGAAG